MAAPPPDVLADLNNLIAEVTGFKESQDNFKACFKYCLSHFVHHTYPSVSKSTITKTLDDIGSRFYTHGQFQLCQAFKEQSNLFLTCEETFRANPECQIEWNLLSFVTSLASKLSNYRNVPPLSPTGGSVTCTDSFDWAAYLKEGLPSYNTFSDDESFSSLSLTDDEAYISAPVSPSPAHSSNVTKRETCGDNAPLPLDLKFRHILNDYRRIKAEKYDAVSDTKKYGGFATQWATLAKKNLGPDAEFFHIAETEIIEIIVCKLLTGGDLSDVRSSMLSFVTHETYGSVLDELERVSVHVKELQSFVDLSASSLDLPVVARAYSSCLREALVPYQLKLLEIQSESPCLLKLLHSSRSLVPYIRGLGSMHSQCVEHFQSEPAWLTSLRFLSSLHAGMLEHHRAELRLVFLGMFLSCLSVFGETLDAMLTSSFPVDMRHEFFILREEKGKSCCYQTRPLADILETLPYFIREITKKVEETAIPLSLVYLNNRFASLPNTLPRLNSSLYAALKSAFQGSTEIQPRDDEITDLFGDMREMTGCVNSERGIDFQPVLRWLPVEATNMLAVSKVVESTVTSVLTQQLDAVKQLAISILKDEFNLDRHLRLLRNLFLLNDSSMLLPFTRVLFQEESSWSNPEYLTLLLRECVAVNYPDLADDFVVVIRTESLLTPNNIVEAIDNITVEYHVPYPVTLVVTEEAIKKYNAIFRVLLKLQWARTLAYLPFPDKAAKMSMAEREVSHRLQVLRFSCLADLYVIINYFMAQVAHTLPRQWSEYQDIQILITDHAALISKIHCRCLLSAGDHHYNLIFDALLPVCFDIRSCWTLQETHIVVRLKRMEQVHRSLHFKLNKLMPYLERENYVPMQYKLKEETLASTFAYRTLKSDI